MADRSVPQKSSDAYRTISEVADELKLPQHVLRFWETRFAQVRPLKRAGGRRFYRPEDVALLRAVQALLYGEGYTIKGVQRLLAELGPRHVADALARSRASAPGGVLTDGSNIGQESAVAMDAEDRPGGQAPAPDAPRANPASPSSEPSHVGRGSDLAARLAAVLSDLAECVRLLASVRSTHD